MLTLRLFVGAAPFCPALAAIAQATEGTRRVIIYDGVVTEVGAPPPSLPVTGANDVWVTLADLERATKFVLKPQGVCRNELCFPIPKARREAFLLKQGTVTWFNLSEFARLLRQPFASDAEQSVWYFGPRAEVQNSYLTSLTAPDFTLPDVSGKTHSLSDFRGKKVLLITWASW